MFYVDQTFKKEEGYYKRCIFVSDIEYLKMTLPGNKEEEFFNFLKQLNANDVKIYAIDEGCVAFPR